MNKKTLSILFLTVLVLILSVVVIQTALANSGTRSVQPDFGLSAAPNSAPHLCPTTTNRSTLIVEVNIEGLTVEHVAEL